MVCRNKVLHGLRTAIGNTSHDEPLMISDLAMNVYIMTARSWCICNKGSIGGVPGLMRRCMA